MKKTEETKLFAFLATFLSIIGFIIAIISKKNDKYVMYYAKQSLVIFILFIISALIGIIPLIGWLISGVVYIVSVILWIMSWIYSLSGEMKQVPLIGEYAKKLNI